MKRLIVLLLCSTSIVVATGCAHKVRFSVIDAESRKPLEGVETEWEKSRAGLLMSIYRGESKLPLSTGSGLVEAAPVYYRKSNHNFLFTKSGFEPATVVVRRNKAWVISPDLLHGIVTNRGISVVSDFQPLNNPMVVPMHRSKK